ncbi:MAG: TetR/AcrR family transcriptional regulator [Bacteroidales bacterium]|nr:TetR/AcrR family transcriptional regulator [Bacteroidales bacterium]
MSENDAKYQSILNSAFNIYTENGIRNISMDDLCRQMGISKKTLYKYVENKADLLRKINNHIHSQIINAIIELGKTDLNAIDILLEMSKIPGKLFTQINPIISFEMRKYYPQVFEKSTSDRKVLITNSIRNNMDQGIKEGLYRQDLNKDIIAQLYFKNIEDFHTTLGETMKKYSFEKIFEVMFENHIRGIANEKGIEYFEKQKEKLNFNL